MAVLSAPPLMSLLKKMESMMLVYVVKTVAVSEKISQGVVIQRTLLDTVIAVVPEYLAPLVVDGVARGGDVVAVEVFAGSEFADGEPALGESWVSNPETL
jgi:hypothetical protein